MTQEELEHEPFHLEGICTPSWSLIDFRPPKDGGGITAGLGHSHQPGAILQRSGSYVPSSVNIPSSWGG